MSTVPSTSTRSFEQKLSERWSVRDFGAVADGVTNAAPAINAAILQASAAGGKEIYLPSGVYAITSRIEVQASHSKVTLAGDGQGTVIKRTGSITAGQGVIDISGSNFGIRDLQIDGNVLTSTGLTYASFGGDPMAAALTTNSSVWIKPGSKQISFQNVMITHSGGYAILMDADTADIQDVLIDNCLFQNNRPHRFGVSATDFGSWTGGIFMRGDCRTSASKLFVVRGVRVSNSRFHRMTGNCIWMHSYGFDIQHENVLIDGNEFKFIGRDGWLPGNLIGGACTGNTARFVGFMHSTDTDTPVAAYLTDNYAVAFDSSGFVTSHNFTGNVAEEFYGGGFDLDGFRNSAITGNIASSSQPVAKGLQTGDTSGNNANDSLVITGNKFKGCNAGAIVLKDAQGCLVENNLIDHPASAFAAPILLYSQNKKTLDNVVRGNDVVWPDASFIVQESDDGIGTGFDSTTANLVYGNTYRGGALGEFYKHPSSASSTGVRLSSNATSLTNEQATTLQREGTGASAAWKLYDKQGATQKQYVQLQFSNGLWNVSENGAVQTGIITTAARTTLGFKDAVWTGKLMTDGFLAAYDFAGAATSFQASDANALTNDWALLRWNKTAGYWEQSVATSAGSRVWSQFSGGGSGISGLTAGRVVFAASGTTITDDTNLFWDDTSKRLGLGTTSPSTRLHVAGVVTVVGTASTAAILVTTGFISCVEGFFASGTTTDSIQSPSGGVTARFLIGTRSLTLTGDTAVNAGLSSAGQGRFYFDSSTNKIRISENGGAYVDLLGGGASQWTTSGSAIYYTTGNVWVGASSDDTSGAKLQITGFVRATTGFATPGTATDAIQALSGGVTARFLIGTRSFTLTGDTAANAGLSSGGQGRFYFDNSTNRFRVSENGGAYVNLTDGITSIAGMSGPSISISRGTGIGGFDSSNTITITNTGVTSLSGTSNQVNVSASTGSITLSLPQNIHTGSAVTFFSLLASDAIQSNRGTGPAIYAPNAWITGRGLVSSGLAAYNSIQSDSGISCGTGSGGGYHVAATQIINTSGQWVGLGIVQTAYGVAASGFNPFFSGTQYFGQNLGSVSVRRGDDTGSGTLTIYGGVIVGMSGL